MKILIDEINKEGHWIQLNVNIAETGIPTWEITQRSKHIDIEIEPGEGWGYIKMCLDFRELDIFDYARNEEVLKPHEIIQAMDVLAEKINEKLKEVKQIEHKISLLSTLKGGD